MGSGSIRINPGLPEETVEELEDGEVLEIGRGPSTSGQRKLLLTDRAVSRSHAEIRCSSSGWTIVAHESTNGTWLNEDVVNPEHPRWLWPGDTIKIATIQLIVDSCPQPSVHDVERKLRRERKELELAAEQFHKLYIEKTSSADDQAQ